MKPGRLGFTLKLKRIEIYDVPYADRWISILLLTLSAAATLVNQLKQLINSNNKVQHVILKTKTFIY